jgi:hypothetical protein
MHCSNCGFNLNKNQNFCPNCGKKAMDDRSKKREPFSYTFSSRLYLGGNILTPDKIIVDETGVTYEKRNKYLIGIDRSFLAYDTISFVKLDRGLINSSIIISSKGSRGVKASNFSISDAKKIKELIISKLY